jgi:hypothetical protein
MNRPYMIRTGMIRIDMNCPGSIANDDIDRQSGHDAYDRVRCVGMTVYVGWRARLRTRVIHFGGRVNAIVTCGPFPLWTIHRSSGRFVPSVDGSCWNRPLLCDLGINALIIPAAAYRVRLWS